MARRRLKDGREEEVPVEAVAVGALIVVRPGEKLALDGRIIEGESALNQAPITGESMPVEKGPGDEVWAGTLNTSGVLVVKVTRLVADSALARIIQMVEEAQGRRAPAQAFVERFAAWYTPLVMGLAALILLVPPLALGQAWGPWIYRALSLLVVACPCALVLSTPVSIVAGIANAARHGILVKGGVYLEELGRLSAIAFDKTGTLTMGEPVLTDLVVVGDSEAEVLALAAAVEAHSEHPLARAVVRAAVERGIAYEPATGARALVGRGMVAEVGGEPVYVGSERLFAELGADLAPLGAELDRLRTEGKTLLLLGAAQRVLAILAVADQPRPETKAALRAVRNAGVAQLVMLTGDNQTTAAAIGAQLGVTEVRAELLPDQKAAAVEGLMTQYGKVAMVGDGVNDAPALATATVGIAMGGAGSDTALETADVVLMADDLQKLPYAVRLSRRTLAVIGQNVAFALAIKALAILLVFPGWLTLWMAVLADTGATVIVTLNGMRLLRDGK
jgi:Cd2+/Zn2+-exporting ATPase